MTVHVSDPSEVRATDLITLIVSGRGTRGAPNVVDNQ